jgi:hypothetical protein
VDDDVRAEEHDRVAIQQYIDQLLLELTGNTAVNTNIEHRDAHKRYYIKVY